MFNYLQFVENNWILLFFYGIWFNVVYDPDKLKLCRRAVIVTYFRRITQKNKNQWRVSLLPNG